MQKELKILQSITSQDFKKRGYTDRFRIFNDFASQFGWHPSDYLGPEYGLETKSNGHLIVEHGLEHAAVITFIAEPTRTMELSLSDARILLEISYNNLVDFHLIVDQNKVAVYFNRSDLPKVEEREIEAPDFAALTAKNFQKNLDCAPPSNIPALDTIVIETIDYWKRFLYGEISCNNKNEVISALFNAIIFVRAVEDHYRLKHINHSTTLVENWRNSSNKKVRDVLMSCLRSYKAGQGASSLLSIDRLKAFDNIDSSIIENIFSDFYKIKRTPYAYNFALMSRHALSRIYEKYVSLLQQEDDVGTKQKTLFPVDLPETQRNKAAGAIYTPQFVPRFFCKFIEEQLPPRVFRELEVADPACGSGIFLRTFLERKIERQDLSTLDIKKCFEGILGIDIDENACQASKLSLSLLHLMRTDKLPRARSLNILTEEAIEYFQKHRDLRDKFGVVIGNPPFVRLELQSDPLRKRVRNFLSDIIEGRPDLYLAFLRLAMQMVKPRGYLAFVLPHSFLIGSAPQAIREELKRDFWIRSIVDLSAIRVFEDYSAYVVLLIAEKKTAGIEIPPPCRVVLCQEFVGNALQDCIENKTVKTPYYSVFNVEQEYFGKGPWALIGHEESRLEQKLNNMSKVEDFLVVREGLITGDDKLYIVAADQVSREEKSLFAPFLPDRSIGRYTVPQAIFKYVYFPYSEGKPVDEKDLKKAKRTWAYLNKIRPNLKESALKRWPYLVRGREKDLLQPKIISPHLVLLPRFALDIEGKFAVSHSPFLIPRARDNDLDLLKYFTAVLNSSVVHWYLGSHAYRFSHGYVKLDPNYVKKIPVPDPSKVSPTLFTKIISLVNKRLKTDDAKVEDEIDNLVRDIYGLSSSECQLLNVEVKK
jgi:tRNA1(Val) A37 N6-methylase TrmN6